MYKRKITELLLVTIFFIGCATVRKGTDKRVICSDSDNVIENTINKNLTEYGFYIQKGKLKIKSENEDLSFLYSVKYARRNQYLISLRSIAGIEALRIFINVDTLLINDRLKREVLYGNSQDFERITGIPVELMKLCFGDITEFNMKITDDRNKEKGEIIISSIYRGIEINSVIDCRINKSKWVRLSTGLPGEYVIIEYKSFKGENYLIPGETNIYDPKRKVRINFENKKFIIPWYGDLEFIPGDGYRKRHI